MLDDEVRAKPEDSLIALRGSPTALVPDEEDDRTVPNSMTSAEVPQFSTPPSFKLSNRVFTDPSISSVLFDFCSVVVLVQLLKTSHRLRNAVKAYIAKAFTVDRVISRYFDDPLSFRSMQASTATIISGSAALQFFDRSFYPSSDLDLYVPLSGAVTLTHFIIENGYTFVPHLGQNTALRQALEQSAMPLWMEDQYSATRGIAGVFGFTKISDGHELTIQVIAAFHATLDIVLHYHSSASSDY